MKSRIQFVLILAVFALVFTAFGQTVYKSLTLSENGTVTAPTNFWTTNAPAIASAVSGSFTNFAPASGSTNIVNVGTITNGTWAGTPISTTYLPVGTSSTNVAIGDLSSQRASMGVQSLIDNISLSALAKTVNTNAPLRVMAFGDSLATGLDVGPQMARAGWITSGASAATFAGGAAAVTSNSSVWITGSYGNIPVGGNAVYTFSGFTTSAGETVADRIFVAYVREPGAATSFDVDFSSNSGSSWTTSTSINATHTSTIGATYTGNLTVGSNPPVYRMRINNVVGGTGVKIVAAGLYNSNGSGAILISGVANTGGLAPSTMNETSSAIVTPIWTALAPDVVLSCWDDTQENWQSGGAIRTIYATTKAAYASTDWVQLAAPPCQDSTKAAGYALARTAQFAWAREFNESYWDSHSFLGGNWTVMNAEGLSADAIHPNTAGYQVRNIGLWNALFLGQVPLGRVPIVSMSGSPNFLQGNAAALQVRASGDPSSLNVWCSNPLTAPQMRVATDSYGSGSSAISPLQSISAGTLRINNQLDVVGTGGPYVTPVSSATLLGTYSKPWDFRGMRLRLLSNSAAPVCGSATLVAGTATISTTAVSATSVIQVTRRGKGSSTAVGTFEITTINAGTSFVITALKSDGTTETGDVSVVTWLIVDAMSS